VKTSNLVTEALRQSESGQQWEEQLSGAQGTLTLLKNTVFRVRATGATTVTIDGVLAMTMSAGEIAIFNTGTGSQPSTRSLTIAVVIAGANAFVQVAREVNRPSTTVNPYNLLNEPVGTGESP
jgi:hypothetical protein